MYTILLDKKTLYNPNIEQLSIIEPIVELEQNSIGSFNFKITKKNPRFHEIREYKSIIEVIDEDKIVFYGRVVEIEEDSYDVCSIYCEGALAYFCDSVIEPFEWKGNISGLLNKFITEHNAQVENEKHFTLGNVTVTDANDYIVRSDLNHNTTWKNIKDKLIDKLGGYLQLRIQNGVKHIDYVKDLGTNQEKVEFSKNLISVKKNKDYTDIATVVYPLGAKDDTGKRLTIESVNSNKKYLEDGAAINKYGRVIKTIIYDDVTIASNLLSKAKKDLEEAVKMTYSISINAISLNAFPLNKKIGVISKFHGIDDYFIPQKIKINLFKPSDNKLDLNSTIKTLTQDSNDLSNFGDNLMDIVENVKQDYQVNLPQKITQLKNELTSKIEQTSTDINLSVNQKLSGVTSDVNEIKNRVYVVSFSSQWGTSTSKDIAPSTWTDTRPEIKQGQYLWIREKYLYSNGSVKYDGTRMISADDGRGVVDIKSKYALSTSNSQAPSSGWQDTVPTKGANQYIWRKEIIYYTDKSITEMTPICISGDRGDQGIPGKNGSNGQTSYLHIAYANSSDGSSGFSTTDSVNKLYIGQYTDFVVNDSTDYKKYKWSLIKGTSISNVTNFYKASGKSTGEVGQLSGGRNLFFNSGKLHPNMTGVLNTIERNEILNIETPSKQGLSAKMISVNATGSSGLYFSGINYIKRLNIDDNCVTSFYIKANRNITISLTTEFTDNNNPLNVTTEWQRVSISGVVIRVTGLVAICLYSENFQVGDTIYISSLKVEIGNQPTPWTPAPEDLGWSTTPPQLTPTNKYMWNYGMVTGSNNEVLSYTPATMIGVYGDQGVAGQNGVGIKNAVVTYQASNSQTTKPTGTWLTSIPKLSPQTPYLWTKTVTNYTDGKSTESYSVSSTLEGVEVGGRNLIYDTATLKSWIHGRLLKVEYGFEDSCGQNNAVKLTNTKADGSSGDVWINEANRNKEALKKGYKTVSFWAKTETGTQILSVGYVVNKTTTSSYQFNIDNTWKKYVLTFLAEEEIGVNRDVAFYSVLGTSPVYFCYPKLEMGNTPTDWTPAPEDVEQNIKDEVASNKATITQEYSSAIEIAKKEINSRVSSITKVVDEHTQKVTNLTSELKQNNTSLQFVTSQVQEFNNSLSGLATKEEIAQMMTFENGILTINASNSEFSMQLSTSELGFYQGHNKVAWINNNELHITNAIMTKGIAVGTETQRLDLKLEDDPTNGWSLM